MAVKDFAFRKNWVGSKVTSMKKQPFLPFLTQTGPTFWPQKVQINNCFNRILVKKGRNYVIYY